MGYLQKPVFSLVNKFSQIENKTIANTTTETSLIGAGIGDKTFSIAHFYPGNSVEFNTKGFISATNGDTARIRLYFGSTVIVDSTATIPATFTNVSFDSNFVLTYRGNNKFIGQGKTTIYAGQALTTQYSRELLMLSEATIDILQAHDFDITYEWGTAREGNTITVTNMVVTEVR